MIGMRWLPQAFVCAPPFLPPSPNKGNAMNDEIMGYRLEWKAGDPCYLSPESYALETYRDSALVHALYTTPQLDCPASIEVYKGWCWVQPKNAFSKVPDDTFQPLYLGPMIHCPGYGEDALLAFPGIVEQMVRASRPDLYETAQPIEEGGAHGGLR